MADPLSYSDKNLVNPKYLKPFTNKKGEKKPSDWETWLNSIKKQVNRSYEEMIEKHKRQDEDIPFWVIIEVLDLGSVSKYYRILKSPYQKKIADRLGIADHRVLENWLLELNTLRNCCAHHTRIWNRTSNPIKQLSNSYFDNLKPQ